MLALDRSMIAEDNITLVEIVTAVDFQPVLYRHADGIGNKDRHAAGALGQQLSLNANKANGVVLVFVDVRAECRARHIGVDLIADGDNAMADHFKGYRIHRNPFGFLQSTELVHAITLRSFWAGSPSFTMHASPNFAGRPVRGRPYRFP